MTDDDLLVVSKFATEEAMRFMRESGNLMESVANRGHDVAIDAILERGGKIEDYKITPWVCRNFHSTSGPTIEIRVTKLPDLNSGPNSKARYQFATNKWDDHYARNALLYFINHLDLDDEFLEWLNANTTKTGV